MKPARIKEVRAEKENYETKRVFVSFGPHYFIDIMPNETGELTVYIGYTHHGFCAKAVNLGDQLEKIIEEVRSSHPELTFD